MVHLMSAGRLKYVAPGAQGREDADVPPALRRRRRAAADRGRLEEARGRLAAATGRARRPSSRTSARRPTSSTPRHVGADPRVRLAAAALAAARPAADRRHRPRLGERDPAGPRGSRPYALSTQVDEEETERLAAAIRDELARGLELRLAGANDAKTYRVHDAARRAVPRAAARRSRASTSRSTRSTTARRARPRAASSRTGASRGCCVEDRAGPRASATELVDDLARLLPQLSPGAYAADAGPSSRSCSRSPEWSCSRAIDDGRRSSAR